ncbi:hypothetical protein DNTS_024151 [Danionella cerebrum]|uniref:Uncharacterized protein n=1 Tax=Danionella cerebrum TaxID=2873325 RepID=A0A553RIF9_9TELE|nr:hypothetical protein DNTS_024151 [Danionella translucida]
MKHRRVKSVPSHASCQKETSYTGRGNNARSRMLIGGTRVPLWRYIPISARQAQESAQLRAHVPLSVEDRGRSAITNFTSRHGGV